MTIKLRTTPAIAAIAAAGLFAAGSASAASVSYNTTKQEAVQSVIHAPVQESYLGCEIRVPSNGQVKLSMPNLKPFTLIVAASKYEQGLLEITKTVGQFEAVFDGNVLTEYRSGKAVGTTKKGSTAFNLEFKGVNIYYVGVFDSAFTTKQIAGIKAAPLLSLLRGYEGKTAYVWPNPGADTAATCLSNKVPYMNALNIQLAPVQIVISTGQSA